jgi:regulator of replication initiation timing
MIESVLFASHTTIAWDLIFLWIVAGATLGSVGVGIGWHLDRRHWMSLSRRRADVAQDCHTREVNGLQAELDAARNALAVMGDLKNRLAASLDREVALETESRDLRERLGIETACFELKLNELNGLSTEHERIVKSAAELTAALGTACVERDQAVDALIKAAAAAVPGPITSGAVKRKRSANKIEKEKL